LEWWKNGILEYWNDGYPKEELEMNSIDGNIDAITGGGFATPRLVQDSPAFQQPSTPILRRSINPFFFEG
jgi:hypothetical protein